MNKKNILLTLITLVILSSCEKADLGYPVIHFSTTATPRPQFKFTLDASASFAEDNPGQLEFRWDLNGDHVEWETDWIPHPTVTAVYPFPGEGIIGLQGRQSSGHVIELYQLIYANTTNSSNYYISEAYSDLNPDFRIINYSLVEYTDTSILSLAWAYDNILQPSSDSVFNFKNSYEQGLYGSLMSWERAMQLDSRYHPASLGEWQRIFDFSCGQDVAGYNLQVDVEHGLHLRCAGIYHEGQLHEFEECGYYWTSEEASESTAWAVKIYKDRDEAELVELDKNALASVRLMFEQLSTF